MKSNNSCRDRKSPVVCPAPGREPSSAVVCTATRAAGLSCTHARGLERSLDLSCAWPPRHVATQAQPKLCHDQEFPVLTHSQKRSVASLFHALHSQISPKCSNFNTVDYCTHFSGNIKSEKNTNTALKHPKTQFLL